MIGKRAKVIILIVLLIIFFAVFGFRLLQWKAQSDLELNTKLANFTDKIDNARDAMIFFLGRAKKSPAPK